MSRSATIVISYIMKKFPDMTWNKALRYVKNKRPIVCPNDGFLRQLKSYERTLDKLRIKDKLASSLPSNTPSKSHNKIENPYSQTYENKPIEDIKVARNVESKNYHYSRGISANVNTRGNLGALTDSYQNDVFANRHKSSFGMNADPSFLEQSLKSNKANILQK